MSLKDRIIAAGKANQGKSEPVTIWGVDANMRVMSGTERDAWEASIFKTPGKKDMQQFRARLLVRTLADENGQRLFADDDAGMLSEMDSVELDRLYTVASRLNALSKEDVDTLTKNS